MAGSDSARQPLNPIASFRVNPEDATPMMRQFVEVKRDYPGTILFYRMGDFYETFFEDATIAARVLEITLTGRDAGKLGRVPMAGIPVKAVDAYLTKLLSKNFKVAICEQIEDPAMAKGLVERKVVRVLSPGTITEQSLLKPEENNFLAAVSLPRKPGDFYGLAYCDITTGGFFATRLAEAQLYSELDRIQPSEVLVPGRKKRALPGEGVDEFVADAPLTLTENFRCTAMDDLAYQWPQTEQVLRELMGVSTLEGYGLTEMPEAAVASGVIGYYLRATFIDSPPTLDRIQTYSLNRTVTMNTTARRNLELLSTVKNNQYEGSLLWSLNKTATSMGARLLRQWLSQPLTDLSEIHSRLDGVEELVKAPSVRESLRRILPDIYDIERLSSKVANLTASPRDLVALKQSIARLPEISNLVNGMKSFYLVRLQAFPPELFTLVALIDQAIDETPALNLKEGGIIKPGYNPELDRLREILTTHESWLANYEHQERERTGIRTLKATFNNAYGYYIEVTKSNLSMVPSDYKRKQTLTNAERYTTDALKQFENQVLDAQSRQFDLEFGLFVELRQKLLPYAALLKDCAHRVAVLDVLQSLATVAVQNNYVKPVVDDSLELNIREGRHPVVETTLPMGKFVPNCCGLSSAEKEFQVPQIMIITGPNMAGKSTFMRQTALIVLMAQMGAFVPAAYARIGLTDALYTRVGAVDDLSSGQSTFMVEMSETAQILNGATRRSLVILDEVGRGTSTFDGVSIAWSVTEYLVNKIGCRTLFATHYHELNTLEETHPKIRNYRVCVMESDSPDGNEIEFLHKVEPGSAQKSYGIQVARMAGVPRDVITRAAGLLSSMQKKELATVEKPLRAKNLLEDVEPNPQMSLF